MNAGQLAIVAVVLIYVIARRFAGSPVGAKSMIMPLVLVVYGISQIHGHIGPKDVTLLAVEMVISLAGGLGRAYTIKLYPKDGHLWQRYTVLTLVVWIAMIGIRLAFASLGHAWGATLASGATVMIAFGFSIFIETLVVAKRAASTGVPIMPRPDRGSRQGVRVG